MVVVVLLLDRPWCFVLFCFVFFCFVLFAFEGVCVSRRAGRRAGWARGAAAQSRRTGWRHGRRRRAAVVPARASAKQQTRPPHRRPAGRTLQEFEQLGRQLPVRRLPRRVLAVAEDRHAAGGVVGDDERRLERHRRDGLVAGDVCVGYGVWMRLNRGGAFHTCSRSQFKGGLHTARGGRQQKCGRAHAACSSARAACSPVRATRPRPSGVGPTTSSGGSCCTPASDASSSYTSCFAAVAAWAPGAARAGPH